MISPERREQTDSEEEEEMIQMQKRSILHLQCCVSDVTSQLWLSLHACWLSVLILYFLEKMDPGDGTDNVNKTIWKEFTIIHHDENLFIQIWL